MRGRQRRAFHFPQRVRVERERTLRGDARIQLPQRSGGVELVVRTADAGYSINVMGTRLSPLKKPSDAHDESFLVRFKPGTIEFNPLPHAPRELGQDLMRKLKAWTGRVWIVAVSDEEGAVPLGVQRREKEARAIESVREHPSVKQVMQHFPGARITAVRPVAEPDPHESDGGAPEEFKEDGTNR